MNTSLERAGYVGGLIWAATGFEIAILPTGYKLPLYLGWGREDSNLQPRPRRLFRPARTDVFIAN